MKAVKYLAIGLGALLALLLIAIALLFMLVNPNDYKGELQALVQKQTGRALQLQGDLRLSVWPRIAIEFGPAALGNAPGFGTEPLLSVERVRLGVKLAPLLHKRVEVDRAELQTPVVRLMVNGAGDDNWTGLSGESSRKQSGNKAASGTALSVAGIRISNGDLSYIDRKAGSTLTLKQWQLDTGVLDLEQPVKFKTSFVLQRESGLVMSAAIDSVAKLDLAHDKYELAKPVIELAIRGAAMPKSGLKLKLAFASLQADLAQQTLTATDMKLDALGTAITGSLNGRRIADAPEFSGPIHVAATAPAELLRQLEFAVPVTRDPKVLQRLELSGQLQASGHALMLNQLRAQLDDSTITGSAGINDLDKTALSFNIHINALNLDRYLAPATRTGDKGGGANGKPHTAEPLPVDWLKGLLLKGDVAIDEAVFAGIKLSKLHLGVDAHGNRLHLLPSEAQLYGGQYRGDISLDVNGALPRVSFNEQVSGVDFARLLKDWFKQQQYSGKGNLSIKAEAQGRDSDALLRALQGAFSIRVDNATIEGKDLWYEIRRANALLHQRAPPERSGPARTVFSTLTTSGAIARGVFSTSDVLADTRGMKVSGGGTIDVPQSRLDLKLHVAVQKAADDTSPDAADINGFTVPVLVSGTLTDPSVRPDVDALVKAAVQKQLDEHKDELKKKLQDTLKSLFH